MADGTARFWFNVTTHKLMKRISSNKLGLFQIDPTYKLIWKGHNVQVHGTSNEVNEFFPTGLVIASHEDTTTFSEFFKGLEIALKFLLADGSKAITAAKRSVWPYQETSVVDPQRIMCFPHVARAISKQNGLESVNGDLKKTKVFRQKQKLGDFLATAIRIVDQFSFKDDSRLYCKLKDLIKLEDLTRGYQWLQIHHSPTSIVKIKNIQNILYTLSSDASKKKPPLNLPSLAKSSLKNRKHLTMTVLMTGQD